MAQDIMKSFENNKTQSAIESLHFKIAELLERSSLTINDQLKNIYDEGEWEPDSTIRKFRKVAMEGTRVLKRLLDHSQNIE